MRQIIITMLVVSMGIFIGGCGEKKGEGTTQAAFDTAPVKATLFLSNLNETIKLDFASSKVYFFDKEELDSAYNNFLDNFTYKNKTDKLDKTQEEVNITSIEALFGTIKTNTNYNEKTAFAALKMHIGMLDKKMVLIYEPVILNPSGAKGFCKINKASNNLYLCTNGNLTLVNNDRANELINNYQSSNSNIYVKHEKDASKDTHKFFVDSTSSNEADRFNNSDARYAIMTFQQIKGMYDYTKKDKSTLDSAISFSLVSNNWFYKGNSNRNNTKNHKLHVVVHCNLDKQAKTTAASENLGADATQIPPPPETNVYIYVPIP